jgi:phosphatidylethanolamine-binding protein (PEBP) family uncharacterized protein
LRVPLTAISAPALVCALVLSGCGTGTGTSTTQVATIAFKSSAVSTSIPARYTCDGQDTPPPLEWGAVPAGTGELALFLIGFTPKSPSGSYALSVEWAVAGLNPKLHKLSPSHLPRGAFAGYNSDKKSRYSVCPKKGSSEHYQFELYAVPSSVVIARKFSGLPVLATLAKSTGATAMTGHGMFAAVYARK